jgi:hypothetical protein
MSEILTDARYSIVDVAEQLYVNNTLVVDSDNTLYIDKIFANIINYNYLSVMENTADTNTYTAQTVIARGGTRSFFAGNAPTSAIPGTSNAADGILSEFRDLLLSVQGINNITYNDSVIVGGMQNEALGKHSVCIGGDGNEANGSRSVVLGGTENHTMGTNSVACGLNAIAVHDNTFVFGTNDRQGTTTTTDSQFVVNATNGLMFKLPKSSTVRTDHIHEGFGVWCWDDAANTLCLKTKQNNTTYKSTIPTLTHEIRAVFENGRMSLINPDDS